MHRAPTLLERWRISRYTQVSEEAVSPLSTERAVRCSVFGKCVASVLTIRAGLNTLLMMTAGFLRALSVQPPRDLPALAFGDVDGQTRCGTIPASMASQPAIRSKEGSGSCLHDDSQRSNSCLTRPVHVTYGARLLYWYRQNSTGKVWTLFGDHKLNIAA